MEKGKNGLDSCDVKSLVKRRKEQTWCRLLTTLIARMLTFWIFKMFVEVKGGSSVISRSLVGTSLESVRTMGFL